MQEYGRIRVSENTYSHLFYAVSLGGWQYEASIHGSDFFMLYLCFDSQSDQHEQCKLTFEVQFCVVNKSFVLPLEL